MAHITSYAPIARYSRPILCDACRHDKRSHIVTVVYGDDGYWAGESYGQCQGTPIGRYRGEKRERRPCKCTAFVDPAINGRNGR